VRLPDLMPGVPQVIPLWKLKAILELDGELDRIEAVVAALPAEGEAMIAIRSAWNRNAEIRRLDPGTIALAQLAGFTLADLDVRFIRAFNLKTALH